jgi:hypothetical protein
VSRLQKVTGTAWGRQWHAYRLDCQCTGRYKKSDPHKLFGVTTALKTLSTDALIGWAAKVTAAHAVDNWDQLSGLAPSDRLAELMNARNKVRDEAAGAGTALHLIAEKLSRGEEVAVTEAQRPQAELLARWMDREQWESWANEFPIAHTTWKYGGTPDAMGVLHRRGTSALIDFKRQPRVYEEVAWQLAGYRYADLCQMNGPASEGAMPVVDATFVVQLLPDVVQMVPVETDPAVHREFLHILQVARARQGVEDNSRIGVPLAPLTDEEVAADEQ